MQKMMSRQCSPSSASKYHLRTVWGYIAGIITGVAYGLNPLFAKPLMQQGISVDTILFYRYGLSVLLLGAVLLFTGHGFRVNLKQLWRLIVLGILFTCSSIFLFYSYNHISSGIATTIVFLYPVLVALIMVFLRVYPTWQVWLSIVLTFVGVAMLGHSDASEGFCMTGFLLAAVSALMYAIFIVIVNRSTHIRTVPSTTLTFYTLLVGLLIFFLMDMGRGESLTDGLFSGAQAADATSGAAMPLWMRWLCLTGLAVFPTIVSTAALAASTRIIGAARASVLGVFEPVTAIFIGTFAFHEPFTGWIAAGIIMTMVAITFMIATNKSSDR